MFVVCLWLWSCFCLTCTCARAHACVLRLYVCTCRVRVTPSRVYCWFSAHPQPLLLLLVLMLYLRSCFVLVLVFALAGLGPGLGLGLCVINPLQYIKWQNELGLGSGFTCIYTCTVLYIYIIYNISYNIYMHTTLIYINYNEVNWFIILIYHIDLILFILLLQTSLQCIVKY